ncbi:hypothetical protein BB560_004287 [Smittium megazygosporum]|uniref:Ribosomal protein L22 n=1 Tax=Smittium megazygosporum TaxID=133381 RepID=A0A2T9Z9N0_9FUNG|nr:hypothetical protein BB560_004287 [Smittium megazygosporum]
MSFLKSTNILSLARNAGLFSKQFNLAPLLSLRYLSSSPILGDSKKEKKHETMKTPKIGASSVFEQISEELESLPEPDTLQIEGLGKKEYRYSTSNFEEAIDQMQFSPKKASKKILHTLAFARKNAIYQKKMDPNKMIVKESWVGKGRYTKELDIKGRGRTGVIHHPTAHMKIVLGEKVEPVFEEGDLGRRRKIRGFGTKRKTLWTPLIETKPIYNPKPYYNW